MRSRSVSPGRYPRTDGRVRRARRARGRPRACRPPRAPRGAAGARRPVRRSRDSLARRSTPNVSKRAGSSACTRTRPTRSTASGSGRAWSSQPAPRRASRSATRSRSSNRSSPTGATPRCSCSPPRRSPTTSSARLRSWLVPGLRAVTFDGDTDTDDRKWARKNANVVLTNPDMLHVGILPSHQRWATFFMRLRYVVVDELHTLRGIFGSHVAHVLRRLRRICEHYGADPTFCFASATIGNPGELASELCGLPVAQIDDDGSPRSERVLACWQRPLLDEHSGARGSANVETAELLARFVRAGPSHARLHPQPPRRRGRRAARARQARAGRGRPRRRASRRTAPATSRRSAARSRSSCRADGCWASRPRTRSSSASTSAGSTPLCSTASRERSRRCGNRPVVPAAPNAARSRCSSRATTSSTSGTSRTRPSSPVDRRSARS